MYGFHALVDWLLVQYEEDGFELTKEDLPAFSTPMILNQASAISNNFVMMKHSQQVFQPRDKKSLTDCIRMILASTGVIAHALDVDLDTLADYSTFLEAFAEEVHHDGVLASLVITEAVSKLTSEFYLCRDQPVEDFEQHLIDVVCACMLLCSRAGIDFNDCFR